MAALGSGPRKNPHHSAVTDEHGTPRKVVEMWRYVMGGIDLDPASSDYWNVNVVKARRFFDERMNGLECEWVVDGVSCPTVAINPPGTLIETPEERRRREAAERTAASSTARPHPGGADAFKKRSVPRKFWERAINLHREGRILCVGWTGFSLEQLVYLQGSAMHPLQFVTNVPCERMSFLRRPHSGGCYTFSDQAHGDLELEGFKGVKLVSELEKRCSCGRSGTGPPVEGGAPTHGNYLSFIPPHNRELAAVMVRRFVEASQRLDMVPGALVRPV